MVGCFMCGAQRDRNACLGARDWGSVEEQTPESNHCGCPSGGLGVPGGVADSGLSRNGGSLCNDVTASMLHRRGTHNGEDCKEQTLCNMKRVGPQCMAVVP